MSRIKACKIDPQSTYPCPCRKQGQLSPIALTEALGCSKCHHIFVIRADEYTLEQLSSLYPYKQLWHWDGNEWQTVRMPFKGNRCVWVGGALGIVAVLLLGVLLLWQRSLERHVVVWMVLIILIAVIAIYMVWLTHHRPS